MFRPLLSGLLLLATTSAASAQDRKPPYWASIARDATEALMRSGPGKRFPGAWLYKRPGLPLRVVGTYQNWRRVQDADGAVGWMDQILLSAQRTAVVRPGTPRPLRAEPDGDAPVRFLAQPGVVGVLSECADGWCKLAVGARSGHVAQVDIWGVEPGEELD